MTYQRIIRIHGLEEVIKHVFVVLYEFLAVSINQVSEVPKGQEFFSIHVQIDKS